MKEKFKYIFRLIIAVSASIGVFLLLGIGLGKFNVNQLVFYTVQSNIVIAVLYSYLSVKSTISSIKERKIVNEDISSEVMSGAMMMIVVTGLIYNIILAPTIPATSAYSSNSLSNILAHMTTPLLVFIDWLFYCDSEKLNKYSPTKWVITPLIYWVYSIIRAFLGGPLKVMGNTTRYAYFFIDSDVLGWDIVFRNVAILLAVFLLLGYLLLGILKIKDHMIKQYLD